MSTHKYFDWFVGAVMAVCVLLTVGFLLKGGQQADSETLIPAEDLNLNDTGSMGMGRGGMGMDAFPNGGKDRGGMRGTTQPPENNK